MSGEQDVTRDPSRDEAGDRLTTSDLAAGETDRSEGPREPDGDAGRDALLPSDEGSAFRERWTEIQVRFVDEPQTAVQDADSLVVELMQQLASTFADERGRLEGEWERGADVSTEDLRQALRHYRSFFDRLLAA
jgi:hypothetical protein